MQKAYHAMRIGSDYRYPFMRASLKTRAKLLRKNAYGLDQKGDVPDDQPMNIEDTATPMNQHQTGVNKVNSTPDSAASEEFPWLGEHEHRFPSRGRD